MIEYLVVWLGEKDFFMKGENNIWKRWWLGLGCFNPVVPLNRNYPIDLFHKSVDWFLYNGKTGLNVKVDAWLR